MKMMRIYISGAISLDPDYREKFAAVKKLAQAMYPQAFEVITPLDIQARVLPELAERMAEHEWLLRDLRHLSECTHIIRITEEIPSHGADIEMLFARYAHLMRLPDIARGDK